MSPRAPTDFQARATAGWEGNPPDWIVVLAGQCQAKTQVAVAKMLGVSDSQVSQAIAGTYKGDMKGLEAKVRGAFMGATVACPVLGDIGRDHCLAEQRKDNVASSSVRMRLYRACRSGCQHSRIKGAAA